MIILEYMLGELARVLPFPKRDVNKYSRGKLLVIGGSEEYPGAAALAAMAAQAMGAGYVEVFCAPESVCTIRAMRPSLVVSSWKGERFSSSFAAASEPAHPMAVLVGSGFNGGEAFCAELLYKALSECKCPLIVDGGAIEHLASTKGMTLCKTRAEHNLVTVVTPHMGESTRMARQARIDVPTTFAAEGSLAHFAHMLADSFSCTVILKGANTFISEHGKDEVYAMRQGTCALAKAGSGDVLAGMVGAIFAQQTDMLKDDTSMACALAVTLHALSGRQAAAEKTDISVVPEDLVDNIHSAIRYMMEFV